jgi:antitoxin component YwqK of YwqJK toxin-antitoxin module
MRMRSIAVALVVVMIVSAGCKVRRISDGKPPHDGVVKKEVKDPRYGTMQAEDHYRDGRLYYSRGFYSGGTTAFERFWHPNEFVVDSTVSYFPSGKMSSVMISSDNLILSFREYFEDGATRIVSDTSRNDEFYHNGTKSCTILFRNGMAESIERWYENGRRMELSEWKNDQRHGKRFEWDSAGRQTVKEFYRQGTLIQ